MNNLKIHKFNEPLRENVDSAVRDLLCECFPSDREIFSHTRYWHGSAPAYSLVYREHNRLAGHIGVVVRKIKVNNVFVTIAGIQNLAVSGKLRGKGVGRQLMIEAMDEAVKRGIHYGLLFCIPELAHFYVSLRWIKTSEKIMMVDAHCQSVPIPMKNITMFKELAEEKFPCGHIDLQGRDW